MEIPTTKPEPLTLLTTLDSVKNIRQILMDQRNTYFQYDPIWVSSPYKLTDFVSFQTDVFNRTGTKDKWVRDTLESIQKWALGNLQVYEKIKSKSFEGTGVKCYLVTNQHQLAPAFDIKTDEGINTMAYSFVWHDDNQQRQDFMLFDFVYFCQQLNDFILKYIDTEFEPKPIIRQPITEPQPKDQQKVKPQPTAAQIALFFHYLVSARKR